jgi:hypothetical protein
MCRIILFVRLVAISVAVLSALPASGEWITEWHAPPYPNFYFLAPPQTPPTDDYKISTGVSPTGQITAGLVGFDEFAFSPGSTTFKLLSLPRPVTVTFDFGHFFQDVWVYNHSTLNFNGGTILHVGNQKGKVVLDDSTLNVNEKSLFDPLNGTSIFAIDAHGQSIINMFPGTSVEQNVTLHDTSHIEADEASFGIGPDSEGFRLHDRSSGTVIYSTFDNVSADGDAILEISVSSIGGNLQTHGSASVALARTDVAGGISAYGSSTVTVAGEDDTFRSRIGGASVNQNAKIMLNNVQIQGGATALGGHLGLDNVIAEGRIEAQADAFIAGIDVLADAIVAGETSQVLLHTGNTESVEVRDSASVSLTDFNTHFIRVYGGHLSFVRKEVTGNVLLYGGEAELTDVESIAGNIFVEESAKLVLNGNTVVFSNVQSSGDAFLTGASVQNVTSIFEGFVSFDGVQVRGSANGTSGGRIQMNSGTVDHDLAAFAAGEVNLSGGNVGGNLVAAGSGIVNMFGGHVAGRALVDQNSTLNYFGGTIDGEIFQPPPPPEGGDDGSAGASIVSELLNAGSASGGLDPLSGKIIASNGSIVNIYGTGLATLLVDPNFVDPETGNIFSVYELTGTLADGSPLAGQLMFLQNDTDTTINLLPPPVPEPTTIVLALLGAAGVAGNRRRSWPTCAYPF